MRHVCALQSELPCCHSLTNFFFSIRCRFTHVKSLFVFSRHAAYVITNSNGITMPCSKYLFRNLFFSNHEKNLRWGSKIAVCYIRIVRICPNSIFEFRAIYWRYSNKIVSSNNTNRFPSPLSCTFKFLILIMKVYSVQVFYKVSWVMSFEIKFCLA